MHHGTSLRLRIATLFLSGLALVFIPSVQAAPAYGEGSEVRFSLVKAGFVTLAIDDAGGKRVRNLIGQTWLEAGPQVIPWDGLDDAGKPVLPGNYRWKGLVHDGVTSEFAGTFNAPGTPPWLTAEISSQRCGGLALRPWTALGLDESPQRNLLGDVGLILADPEGTRAVARHYYFDRGSQVVSDLPSEVRVDPSQWGEIKF